MRGGARQRRGHVTFGRAQAGAGKHGRRKLKIKIVARIQRRAARPPPGLPLQAARSAPIARRVSGALDSRLGATSL